MQSLIITLTIALLTYACAGKYKDRTPINFDIAYELPFCVLTRQSVKIPSGNYFYVKRSLVTSYRIDKVIERGEVILDGDPRDLDRIIFLVHLDNGQRYLRIVTKSKYRNTLERKVQEFMSFPVNFKFTPVVRAHVELDISTQGNTNVIKVVENHRAVSKRFSVRPDMKLRYTIGVIRHANQILNCRVQGLIERTVIIEGVESQRITIVSIYADGDQTIEKYKSSDDEKKKFIMESRKLTEIFTQPCDEKDLYDNPISGLDLSAVEASIIPESSGGTARQITGKPIATREVPGSSTDAIKHIPRDVTTGCLGGSDPTYTESSLRKNLRGRGRKRCQEKRVPTELLPVDSRSIQGPKRKNMGNNWSECEYGKVTSTSKPFEDSQELSTPENDEVVPLDLSDDESSTPCVSTSVDCQHWKHAQEGRCQEENQPSVIMRTAELPHAQEFGGVGPEIVSPPEFTRVDPEVPPVPEFGNVNPVSTNELMPPSDLGSASVSQFLDLSSQNVGLHAQGFSNSFAPELLSYHNLGYVPKNTPGFNALAGPDMGSMTQGMPEQPWMVGGGNVPYGIQSQPYNLPESANVGYYGHWHSYQNDGHNGAYERS